MNGTEEIVNVKEVVFTEEDGRVYSVRIGLKLSTMWLEELCEEILGNLYHLETKPSYELVLA